MASEALLLVDNELVPCPCFFVYRRSAAEGVNTMYERAFVYLDPTAVLSQ